MKASEISTILQHATEMVDRAYRATAGAEELGARLAQAQAEIEALAALLEAATGEALYWKGRAELTAKALRLWSRYDRTKGAKDGGGLAQARAYCAALSATRDALAQIAPGALQ